MKIAIAYNSEVKFWCILRIGFEWPVRARCQIYIFFVLFSPFYLFMYDEVKH